MTGKSLTRLRIISVLIILAGAAFAVKLYLLQFVEHQDFVALADKQYVKQGGQAFSRGTIYFSDKDGNLIPAATLETGYLLTLNPTLIKDKEGTYQKINAIYPLDHATFIAAASKPGTYAMVKDKVPEDKGQAIAALDLAGVGLYKENWRFYPGGSTAANVLGILGYDANNNFGGRYGLEAEYNSVLDRDTSDDYANFFVQIFSGAQKLASSTDSFEGDVVATIEPTVQASLEQTIAKIQSTYSSEQTGGIIMDPKTGEIYAMASVPTFDPNNFQNETNVSVFSNPNVDSVFEMGSIIKALTMAAGIDTGVITPTTTYDDTGTVTANGMTVHNHDLTGHGIISMQTVINDSLNTGVAFVLSKLGDQQFANYMFKFGLGEKTGIDLPDEAEDLVSNLKSPRQIEYITASFGQGIAMTPIATIRALASIANGGYLVTPHVVKRIDYTSGLWKDIDPPPGPRTMSAETSEKVTTMLVTAVDTALLSGSKNPHYSVAGKTGTAQIAMPGGGGYYPDEYLHSFMGYFPAYDPKFIILLYTVDPHTELFAANTLGQPFLDLSKFLINYYQLPPDR